MKHTNIFTILLYFAALVISGTANAQSTSEIKTDKTATYNYTTRTGIITLDSFVTGYVKEVRTAIPADIVLVLDFSSSMADNNKNTMLQTAASNFVDSLALSANRNNVNHRIGVITFGTGAHIKTDFLSVQNNAANVATIKGYINSTCPAPNEGATRYDLAMMLAKNMIVGGTQVIDIPQQTNSNSAKTENYTSGNKNPKLTLVVESGKCVEGALLGTQSGSTPFVVFLTDGEPTGAPFFGNLGMFTGLGGFTTEDTPGNGGDDGSRYGSSSSWTSDHMFGIANHAINTSYYLKNEKNTSVYSIQLGTPSGTGKANLCEDALKAISSLYINAERYRQKYWGAITSGTTPFYQHITSLSQASISGAFTQISSSIEKVIAIQYGEETIMNDFINNSYFKLTDAVDPDNPWTSINVYKVKCTGVDTDGSTRTFSTLPADTVQLYQSDGIILKVVKAAEGSTDNDQISVAGFDYSANWCGVTNTTPHGYKLLVKVPFMFTGEDETVPSTVETNDEGSGVYPAERDEEGNIVTDPETGLPVYSDEPEKEYISPTITFCRLKVTRYNLDRGESAIYEVTQDGKFVARLSLNGTDAESVSKILYGLPGGVYKVTETGWNWAYLKDPTCGWIEQPVDNPDSTEPVNFVFRGVHKTGTGPEEMHNHDEEYKVNIIDVTTFPSPKAAPMRKEEDNLFE